MLMSESEEKEKLNKFVVFMKDITNKKVPV